MQGMSQALSQLMPLIVSDERFANPKNRQTIESSIAVIKGLSHQIMNQKQLVGSDPSLQFFSRKLVDDILAVEALMKSNHLPAARQVMGRVTNYCFACHSMGPDNDHELALTLKPNLEGFSNLEQAEYFGSVRQFIEALNHYDLALKDKGKPLSAEQWDRVAKKSLAIAVRVKQHPRLALELVSQMGHDKAIPAPMKKKVNLWRQGIRDWIDFEEDPKRKVPTSPAMKFEEAKLIVSKLGIDEKLQQPFSDTYFIDYLRASALLGTILKETTDKGIYGQSLFYSGVFAEALKEINMWTLHEPYYEACIRYQPKTALAKGCYKRLDESVKNDSDSGLKIRLDELKVIAGL
jgi:hypothetical protein